MGEYFIVKGHKAVAIPIKNFTGSWVENETGVFDNQFLNYCENSPLIKKYLDLTQMKNTNLYFSSSIPQKSGLGSSGAYVAAIVDRFLKDHYRENIEIKRLKEILALTESFFHGVSSGLDPLTSYLKKGIYLEGKSHFDILHSDAFLFQILSHFELIDSGVVRSNKGLVNFFIDDFSRNEKYQYMAQCSDDLVKMLITNKNLVNRHDFNKKFKEFSLLQREVMSEWIPEILKDQWVTDSSCMKLCGAGSGGHFLKYNFSF